MIQQAPLTFTLLVLAAFLAAWVVARGFYRHQLENAESRFKLKDAEAADYKRKLDGATPDEAKDRLEKLEALVGHLKPRELSLEQKATLLRLLRECAGHVRLEVAMNDRPAQGYFEALAVVFQQAGWRVDRGQVLGAWGYPNAGLRVYVPGDLTPTPTQQRVMAALGTAGIQFDRGDTMLPEGLDVRIVVEPRLSSSGHLISRG